MDKIEIEEKHENKTLEQQKNKDINDFKDLIKNSQNLKKRLQQFETNFEFKFTNKSQKKEWYDAIMNVQSG